jgi:hypothetical protein
VFHILEYRRDDIFPPTDKELRDTLALSVGSAKDEYTDGPRSSRPGVSIRVQWAQHTIYSCHCLHLGRKMYVWDGV